MKSITMPQLVMLLVAILIIWSIFRSRDSFPR